jgi:hypothetical protein
MFLMTYGSLFTPCSILVSALLKTVGDVKQWVRCHSVTFKLNDV